MSRTLVTFCLITTVAMIGCSSKESETPKMLAESALAKINPPHETEAGILDVDEMPMIGLMGLSAQGAPTVKVSETLLIKKQKTAANPGLSSAAASGSSSASGLTVTSIKQKVQPRKKLSASVELGIDSNLRDSTDSEHDQSTYIDITASYRISSISSIGVRVGGTQSLVDERKAEATNTTISISRDPIKISLNNSLKSTLFGVLPTNQTDREHATLQGGTGATVGIENKSSVLRTPVTTSYTLSALKNFHEYTRTDELNANISHRVRHIGSIGLDITPKLNISVSGFYQTGWTYNNAFRSTFSMQEQVSYAIASNAFIGIHHTNEGKALKANGVDSNIRLYDDSTSYYGASLMMTY